MKRISMLTLAMALSAACANTNCREVREKSGEKPPAVDKALDPMNRIPVADRVKVFKPDGSLQCGQGKAIPPNDMKKELGSIQVLSAATKNDGMMRIQMCGAPTGSANVFEINRKDLEAALKLGFKEWTAD